MVLDLRGLGKRWMMSGMLQDAIDSYIENHWADVVADLDTLVHIESVEKLDEATGEAPYGPGPRAALTAALNMAERMGFEVHDCEGRIGYADMLGESDTQIGIIGHVDVVPAGPGWTFPPFEVSHRDGYLIGRGVADDKGPVVVALHALKFWRDRLEVEGRRFPYTVRFLFGANEETNMKDVAYYRERYSDPAFLFTPDAEFPVCYGESGICSGTLSSAPISEGVVAELEGGVAVNAVPGQAWVRLICDTSALQPTGKVEVEQVEGGAIVRANGKPAHASTPELGENAIDILAAYLLENDVLSEDEKTFFEMARKVTAHYDGTGLGIAATDEHLGDLTSVVGKAWIEDGRICFSIDFRYPTTTTSTSIEKRVNEVASASGASFIMQHDKVPFLMDPSSPAVKALLDAYNEVTGEHAEPFTMKGGTYARVFTTGVSFGPEKPWEPKPEWVGGMHGPDEGIREDLLKQAFGIYVCTIQKLMSAKLQA